MLPGNTATTLLSQYLRGQQGVVEAVKLSPDDIRLTVGEKVQATVTNQLPNGRFAVLIKDQLLDLNLPRNTQPGEKLDLTVVGKSPTLTFSLAPQDTRPQSSAPNVLLSKGANLLNDVLTNSTDAKAAVLQQSQPLFSGKPDAAAIASQLAGRLAESGLFYESHQAEWVTGQRPLQALLREPQSAFLPANPDEKMLAKEGAQSGKAAVMPEVATSADDKQRVKHGLSESSGNTQTQKLNDLPPEQAMRQLVRQQVDLLEQRPLIWQGNAWPDQPLRWELELQNESQSSAEQEAELKQWQTKLDLTLPNLGAVGVVATLQQGRFAVRFTSGNAETAALIESQQLELRRRFDAAGLSLQQSQVSLDES